MKRVTADSNILISAFLRGGKPLELLELARAGQVELGVSDAILDETARVLKDKFHVPEEDVRDLRQELLGFAKHVTPAEALDAVPRDETDNLFEQVHRRSVRGEPGVTPRRRFRATSIDYLHAQP